MRVGLVQVNMGTAWGESERSRPVSIDLLPYSVALLQGYARRHAAERHEFLVPICGRLPVAEAAHRLRGADVIGFSAYVWNVELSLAIARRIKSERPETVIVFGGPQVPDHAEAFLRAHPYIDLVGHGEGEATFTRVLDVAPERDWAAVPGVSFLDGGRFVTRPRQPRITLLDEIPSPFLEGEFDALIAASPANHHWIAMWETNRGCPFSCSFCDWGSATASKVYRFGMERLMAEIEWMADQRIGIVLCCDANFGMLKRDVEIAEAMAASKAQRGFPYSFSVQNTKNAVERGYQVQKLLKEALGGYGVTISVQSTNPETLRNINRANISSDAFRELQRRFARDGIYTYTDIIIGLPGESYPMFAESVSKAIADGQHNHIQFHNCSVLPNAEMGNPEYQARFGMRLVPQPITTVHGTIQDPPEVEEFLDLVIATDALPPADWRRAKVFAWLVDMCYFDRLAQIPFAVLAARHGFSCRELVEALVAAADDGEHPVLASILTLMDGHARAIQQGGSEYLAAPQWAGLQWPADQYALLELVDSGRLDDFYRELGAVLERLLLDRGGEHDLLLLRDALTFNRALLTVPFQNADGHLVLSHRIWDYYQELLRDDQGDAVVHEQLVAYTVDRTSRRWQTIDEYCGHLVRCQNKDKRAYLYSPRESRSRRVASRQREPMTNSPTVVSA